MLIYLVRHGEAKREEEDVSRPLSEKGFNDAREMAAYLAKIQVKVDKIYHSPKLRAKQTAEVLNEFLKPEGGITETDGLLPLDDPKIWHERLIYEKGDIMLVGHLPHLSKLSAWLLVSDENKEIIKFEMAGVVCLEKDERGVFILKWMLTPSVILS